MPENTKTSKKKQVEELKERGNGYMKEGRYIEAVMEYSHALKLDPKYYQIYSNRSYAFIKLEQYYYALQDANETILLQPTWPKGYFRKGEVEFACHRYDDAILSYGQAVKLSDSDDLVPYVLKAVEHAEKQKKTEKNVPWIGVAVGFIIGVILVLGNFLLSTQDALVNPFMALVILFVVSIVGFLMGKAYLYYKKSHTDFLLEPPANLFPDEDAKEQEEEEEDKSEEQAKPRARYSKAAAWQRYKSKRKHS